MVFNIFFPLAFIAAFMFSGSGSESINIGVIDNASNISSKNFTDLIKRDPLFEVTQGSEINLKEQLLSGEQVAIIVVPESFDYTEGTNELKLLLDASQVRQISQIRTAIENSLLSVERKLSNTEPMFSPYLMTTTTKVIKTIAITNQEQILPVVSEKESRIRVSFLMGRLIFC